MIKTQMTTNMISPIKKIPLNYPLINKVIHMPSIMEKLIPKYNLIFVRHGNTALNEDGDKIRGWKDVPLSPKGEEEAKRVGEQLKDKEFKGIISSDLKRARQTAKEISRITGKPILGYTKSLRPWDAGIYTGTESSKVMEHFHRHINNPDEKIPEGESFNTFKKRYLQAILDIKKYFKGKPILIVAHHRNNVMLDAWIKAGRKNDLSIDSEQMKKKGISPSEYKEYTI